MTRIKFWCIRKIMIFVEHFFFFHRIWHKSRNGPRNSQGILELIKQNFWSFWSPNRVNFALSITNAEGRQHHEKSTRRQISDPCRRLFDCSLFVYCYFSEFLGSNLLFILFALINIQFPFLFAFHLFLRFFFFLLYIFNWGIFMTRFFNNVIFSFFIIF